MPKARWGRFGLSTVAALALAVLVLTLVGEAEAVPAFPTHRCGSFRHHIGGTYPVTYTITVFNGHVSCQTATGVIRAFWSGHGVTHHGGPSDAQSYWTLKNWPGWRCGQGAGAGACTRGQRIAGYEVHLV